MRRLFILIAACFLFFSLSGMAGATIITDTLDIDFRSDVWSGAHGNDPYSVVYPGVTVKANVTKSRGRLYQDSIDGLGILGDENDEIDDFERLDITFTTAQYLEGVWITDLFGPPDGNHPVNGEIGRVKLYDESNTYDQDYVFLGKDAHQGNGELYVDFTGLDVKVFKARFFVVDMPVTNYNHVNDSCDNEFSVAGFNVAPVPEPATMVLFGMGLIGLAGVCRKK